MQMALVSFSNVLESASATDVVEEIDRGQHLATVTFHSGIFLLGT
jgi:hypothetical protein